MQRPDTNLLAYLSNGERTGRCVTAVLVFLACSVLSACHHRRLAAEKGQTEPVLSANPNPVPAGDLDQPLGSTRVSWNTRNHIIGDLYMKVNRSPEVFLARGSAGVFDAKWIQFDALYEFRLYSKKHSKLLAKVQVTRDD